MKDSAKYEVAGVAACLAGCLVLGWVDLRIVVGQMLIFISLEMFERAGKEQR